MKVSEAAIWIENLLPALHRACHACRPPAGGERQARLLDHLDPRVPAFPGALARHMGVSAASVTLAVDRLVARGLALRERAPGDARRLGVRLTAAGAALRDSRPSLDPDRVRTLLRRLSPRKRRRALRGLRLLARAAGAEVPPLSPRLPEGGTEPPAPEV